MIDFLFMPAILMILGAFILPVLPQKIRASVFLVFPLAALAVLWQLPDEHSLTVTFGSYELGLMYVDSLSRIFGTIFAMVAVIGGIYAFHIEDTGQQSSALLYAGGALGVAFAGDWITLYIFWELMAVSSTYLIWARKTEESDKAGMRYLIVHIFGGSLLLGGILWHIAGTGSILITSLPDIYTIPSVLILLGVAVNSAIPPLHAWLTDAYPKATVTGAVFMCAFTTKSAVYVLIRVFPGWDILIWLGAAMAIYGTIYALMSNDIRQILSYSIISQIGYMVTGIGVGSELALNGATAHAFGHILYKSLLFMGAGAVLYSTGKSKLTELGGLAKKMKWTVCFYMIGAFAISGFPLFNGFISKTMVVSAVGEAHLEIVMLLLLMATVGTFLHTGLKLPYFTWFGERKTEIEVGPIPFNMLLAMGFGAFFCILFGLFPGLIYQNLPYPVDYTPFSVYNLVEMIQILVLTFIGFWLLRTKLKGDAVIAVDTDWFYRKSAPAVRWVFVTGVDRFYGHAEDGVLVIAGFMLRIFKNPMTWLNPFGSENNKASTYSPGLEVVMSFILLGFLVLSFFYFM
ncbi:MAG: Na(+)/H(+) antiporter subunit D [Balneolaceae bacterium]